MSSEHNIDLLPGQLRLLSDHKTPALAAVGGVGSGKTTLGFAWHHDRCLRNNKCKRSLVCADTFTYAKNVNFKGYIDFLEALGWCERKEFTVNRSDLVIRYFFGHEVLFLSAQNSTVAYNASHLWRDEGALYDRDIFQKLDMRVRDPHAAVRQTLDTTTPEGLNFFYEAFGTNVERVGRYSINASKVILHSSSYDNPYLPADYLDRMKESFGWDELYWQNYVLGEWTNLARNAFYFSFDKTKQVGNYPPDHRNKTIYLCFDFNVGQMTWIAVQKGMYGDAPPNSYFAVRENGSRARNIQEACDQFKRAFNKAQWGEHRIIVLGDATGHQRSDQSFTTGYELIKRELVTDFPNLTIQAHHGNPFVAERSFCTNKLLSEKRLYLDSKCSKLIASAQACQSDGKGGIVKPKGDTVTHPMEALDMGLIDLEPITIRRGGGLSAAV